MSVTNESAIPEVGISTRPEGTFASLHGRRQHTGGAEIRNAKSSLPAVYSAASAPSLTPSFTYKSSGAGLFNGVKAGLEEFADWSMQSYEGLLDFFLPKAAMG